MADDDKGLGEKAKEKIKQATSITRLRTRNAFVNKINEILTRIKGAPKNVARLHFVTKDIEGIEQKSYEKLQKEIVDFDVLNDNMIKKLDTIEKNWNQMEKVMFQVEKDLQKQTLYTNQDTNNIEVSFHATGSGRIQKEIEIYDESMKFWVPFVDRLRYPDGCVHEIQTFGYLNLKSSEEGAKGWLPVIEDDVLDICQKVRSKYLKEKLDAIQNAPDDIDEADRSAIIKNVKDILDKTERGKIIDDKDTDDILNIKKMIDAGSSSKKIKALFSEIDNIIRNIMIIKEGVIKSIGEYELDKHIDTTEREMQGWIKGLTSDLKNLRIDREKIDTLKVSRSCDIKIYYDHTYKVVKPIIYDSAGYPVKVLREDGIYELRKDVYIDIGSREDIKDANGEIIGRIIDNKGKPKKVDRVVVNSQVVYPPDELLLIEDIRRCRRIDDFKENKYLKYAEKHYEWWWNEAFDGLYEKKKELNLKILKKEGEYKIGCDRNGWPLEVDEKGACLLDKWEGRAPRKFPDEFIEDFDLLHVANSVNNEFDIVRDDWRDARFHRFSLTSTDYAMASNPPYMVPSLLKRIGGAGWEWKPIGESALMRSQKSIKEFRSYIMRTHDKNNKEIFSKKGTRAPTNLNPAFDRRALKKEWYHIGRKYYYGYPDCINYYAKKDGGYFEVSGGPVKVNDDPTIGTRGLAMYIVDRITREEKTWKDIDAALAKFKHFDYGPRVFPGEKYAGKFAEKPYYVDIGEVREEKKGQKY